MNEKEVYICPILMRTVILIDRKCTEDCDEDDCPISETISLLYRQTCSVIKQQVETAILQSATIDPPLSHRVCHP